MDKEIIIDIMKEFDNLLRDYDYTMFEVALTLYLRSDIGEVEERITDDDLEAIEEAISDYNSLLNDDIKQVVDSCLMSE